MPSIKLAARGTGDVRRLEYTKQMPDKQACHNPILLTNAGIDLYLVKRGSVLAAYFSSPTVSWNNVMLCLCGHAVCGLSGADGFFRAEYPRGIACEVADSER